MIVSRCDFFARRTTLATSTPSAVHGGTNVPPETTSDQLKNLFEYTKFHIGLYATALAATIATTLRADPDGPINRLHGVILCFCLAGLCGGIIASSICEHPTYSKFEKAKLGPLGIPLFTFKIWAAFEHSAFWTGVFLLVWAYWR